MLNIIKMDLHRFVRQISFFVMIAVVIAIAVFSVGVTKYDLDKNGGRMIESDEIVYGITVNTNPEWANGEITFAEMVNVEFASCLMLILCVIFVPLFVGGEQKNGFIKNIAGQLPNRGMLVVSKLLIAALQVFLILSIHALSVGVAGRFYWGERFVLGSISDFLTIFGLHYLLHFSFSAIVLMLTIVVKSTAFSMTFGILWSAGIHMLLYTLINRALHYVKGFENFDISRYMVETNIGYVTSQLASGDRLRILLVGVMFAVVSAAVSMTVLQKCDIR